MMTFTYVDHAQKGSYVLRGNTFGDGVFLFECESDDILDAHSKFKEATGLEFEPNIGVYIKVI